MLSPAMEAVFMDNARSPLWQKAKHGALNPVMRMAHHPNPISEEDLRYTLAGGFHPSDLDGRVAAVGCWGWFRPLGFSITWRLARRRSSPARRSASTSAAGRGGGPPTVVRGARMAVPARPRDASASRPLARALTRARENRMRLVRGFNKPAGTATVSPSTSAER